MPASSFFHRNVVVLHARELFCQFGQFEIMGCEERLGPSARVNKFDRCPSDCQAIVGRCAAAHFVQQNQGAWRRGVQNRSGLRHLNHEGGTTTRQVVASADAGEHAVYNAQPRRTRWNERSHLSQNHSQRSLPEIG